jgi:hypothetical protein
MMAISGGGKPGVEVSVMDGRLVVGRYHPMAQGVLVDVDQILDRLSRGELVLASIRADVHDQLLGRLLALGIEVEG